MSTLLNACTVPRPARKTGTSARLALLVMTGTATSPPRAADCAGEGCHQRVSTRIAAAPAASRAVIRTKRRTSAPGYRFLAGAMAERVTKPVMGLLDFDRLRKVTLWPLRMEEAAGGIIQHATRISKIWPH